MGPFKFKQRINFSAVEQISEIYFLAKNSYLAYH